MHPYPPALKNTLQQFFFFEAELSLSLAKNTESDDIFFVMAHLVRSVYALSQVFYARIERYFLNEKHAVRAIESMPIRPNAYPQNTMKCSTM